MQQFLGLKVVLVFDEIISQTAIGDILHYQPQVPASCDRHGEGESGKFLTENIRGVSTGD